MLILFIIFQNNLLYYTLVIILHKSFDATVSASPHCPFYSQEYKMEKWLRVEDLNGIIPPFN